MRTTDFIIAFLGVWIIGFVGGFGAGLARKDSSWERKSVDAGHAQYYLDHEHKRQWRWSPACCTNGELRLSISKDFFDDGTNIWFTNIMVVSNIFIQTK